MTTPYTEGFLDAPLILVGEAPGQTEVSTGLPFQGPSGDILNQSIHAAGLTRQDCYLTNVFKFRPADNDAQPYLKAKEGTTEHGILLRAQEELRQELAATSGGTIVTLGETALRSVVGLSGVTKRRGSVYQVNLGGRPRNVVACLHPAAALRTYAWRQLITWDLCRAAEILHSGWHPVVRDIKLRPSYEQAMRYLDECGRVPLVGFDVEVVNEELYCFAVGKSASDIMVIGLADKQGDLFHPDQEAAILAALGRLFDRTTILGQNLNFDYTFMLKHYGLYMKRLEDTMIAQAILYPDFPKGLDFITSLHTTQPYYKDEGKQYNKVENVERFWIYNANDVGACLEAWPEQRKQLEQLGNLETYHRQRDTIQQLAYMQHRGIRMDYAGMEQAARDATMTIERLEGELNTMVQTNCSQHLACLPDKTTKKKDQSKLQKCLEQILDKGFNANSPTQVATYFYTVKGLPPYKARGGGLTTDEDALKRVARKGHPEAKLILDIREQAKARGTYYTMQLDEDKRLRCSMNPVGTKQGRFSSSKTIFGTGGNMQNQPREMLGYMIADPGCYFVSLDLEQAENRIVAVLANDQKMLAAFANDEDIHSLTASYILNKPVSEVSKEDGTAPIGPSHWSERDLGKRTNHGLNYDMSYVKFALKNEMQEKDAKYLVEFYHSIYTGVRGLFHYEVKQAIYNTRRIANCFGRVRLFLDRISDETFREGYSFVPQSTVADIINEYGLNFIERESLPGGHFDTIEFMNNVHDSLVLQIPLDHPSAAASISALIQNLEKEINWKDRTFRIPVGISIGYSLSKKKMATIKPHGALGTHWIEESDILAALEKVNGK